MFKQSFLVARTPFRLRAFTVRIHPLYIKFIILRGSQLGGPGRIVEIDEFFLHTSHTNPSITDEGLYDVKFECMQWQ